MRIYRIDRKGRRGSRVVRLWYYDQIQSDRVGLVSAVKVCCLSLQPFVGGVKILRITVNGIWNNRRNFLQKLCQD